MDILKEFGIFLLERKKFWLWPTFFFAVLLGGSADNEADDQECDEKSYQDRNSHDRDKPDRDTAATRTDDGSRHDRHHYQGQACCDHSAQSHLLQRPQADLKELAKIGNIKRHSFLLL